MYFRNASTFAPFTNPVFVAAIGCNYCFAQVSRIKYQNLAVAQRPRIVVHNRGEIALGLQSCAS